MRSHAQTVGGPPSPCARPVSLPHTESGLTTSPSTMYFAGYGITEDAGTYAARIQTGLAARFYSTAPGCGALSPDPFDIAAIW